MAKRDKLYTVNKWNRPFFEEEQRRKKLFSGGGDTTGIIPGLNLNQAWKTFGLGKAPGIGFNYTYNMPFYTTQDNVIGRDAYVNPYQEIAKTYAAPTDQVSGGGSSGTSNPDTWEKVLDNITNATDSLVSLRNIGATPKAPETPDYVKKISNYIKPNTSVVPASVASGIIPAVNKSLYTGLTENSLASSLTNPDMVKALSASTLAKNTTKALTDQATTDAIKASSQRLADNIMSNTAKSGISSLGKAGINLGASIGSELGYNWISNGLSTGAGQAIKNIGSAAGTALQFIPGVGWAAAPIVTLASGILGGIANQWGHKTFDNGATAYTNRLNAMNPNGSNEYLANLLANTGIGPRATYKDGWFTDKGKREARNINNMQDLAYSRFQRGIKDAIANNNTFQLWNAMNNISAMGGKINRCKCNKKSYGGYLDSASPTGFNFLSDLTNIQMQKNQNQGGTATSVGNSFMNTPDMGITFAKGGIMIKPENRGKLTRLKKRTGKTEAELYNDGNPEHRKMVVFARNARKWKKALGGKINYGEDKDIRNNSFLSGQTMYDLGGILQASGSNWGNVSQINEGGTHEENPYEGVQVGVDPEGTPNLVEEGEVIWNDYVFSNRITVPKEVCKRLRIGQKKDGYTFADVAKKLLVESKERPNDPISKNGLEANMQLLEDAQEEVKRKMEAEQAVEQFNSLPPEQQVAIMTQEGQRAQDAVAQEQMAQEIQNMPPEQQQAIAQQMAMEQAQAQGQPSPEEQAMMQQQMAQQQGINPQEAIAQASAMQQQALGGMALGGKLCFGGRRFAEGGELNGEQPTEQADNEMAKYSDEELQDMIDDYQEAESGEVKVTKGKLARLKKKAEKAEAELERRHADENEEQPQETRQEPSQEELQAAAQAQAMQTQQPIEGQPQEGMSPEQAMMMQQQMGGQPQMSPKEMAAMELQQQGNGQYAYGGKLYLTGGDLMGMFGLNTDSEITKAGWTPEMFGISSWYDEIPQTVVDEWVSKGSFPWLSNNRQTEKWIPDQNIRRAIERGYNPFIPQRTQDQYEWHKPPRGADSPFFTSGNWAGYYGEEPTKNTKINNDQYKAFIAAYPNALSGLEYTDGMTLGYIDDYMKNSANWKLRQDWLWNHTNAGKHRLDYMANIAENNEEAIKKNNAKKFSALGIYDFKKTDSGYSVQRKKGVTDEQEKQWWDAVTSDYKYGDMYNTPDGPLSRDVYIDQDTGDVMYLKPGSDWTQVGNPYSSFINGTDDKDPGYNQNIYFYKRNGSATPDSSGSASDESNYLTVGWKPKTDWTGLALGVAPGLTGLAMQLGRGAPDMSELDKAVAAYERNTGTMVAPHLTHGLIRPAIIDPRVTENNINARRLGTNRLLMNTGSTPSRGATILANDANTIGQLGQAMINNWRENRQQEQAAAAFNRETNTTNANILNQVDQFNAQTQSALARDAAQLRYNVAKDKIAARDAYYAGLMGNLGSVFKGGYEAWRENQRKNERDLLAASGVFGETNSLIDDWLGISKVDPKTHKVVRGYNTGMYYWINPNTGKAEYLKTPPLATNPINACGGKIKKNKKRKGYTF